MRYAQINADGVCFAVSDLSGEVNSPDMILVGAGENPAGKRYEDGIWKDVPQPIPDPDPPDPLLQEIEDLKQQLGTQEEFFNAQIAAQNQNQSDFMDYIFSILPEQP